jgi:hypothetical protein
MNLEVPVDKVYIWLEKIFWVIASATCFLTCMHLVYQLANLYLPYWWFALTAEEGQYEFPKYFYRVYGDNVQTLQFEHYGYLLSALVVTGITAPHLVKNYPFTKTTEKPKSD